MSEEGGGGVEEVFEKELKLSFRAIPKRSGSSIILQKSNVSTLNPVSIVLNAAVLQNGCSKAFMKVVRRIIRA